MSRLFSGTRSINLFLLVIVLLGSAVAGAGDEKSLGQATVSAPTLKAFAEASPSSRIVRKLKKGDVVSIILKVTTSGDDWCRIVVQGQSGLTGYVDCKGLTPISSTKPSQPGHEQATGNGQSLPATAVGGRQEPTGNQTASHGRPLSNTDILNMHKAGLPAEILIAKIRSSICDFDTGPLALTDLKKGGVPDKVILAMIDGQSQSSRSDSQLPDSPQSAPTSSSLPQSSENPEVASCDVHPDGTACKHLYARALENLYKKKGVADSRVIVSGANDAVIILVSGILFDTKEKRDKYWNNEVNVMTNSLCKHGFSQIVLSSSELSTSNRDGYDLNCLSTSEEKASTAQKPPKACKDNPEWSMETCNRVKNREIWVGMTETMLLKSRGRCADIHTVANEYGVRLYCDYGLRLPAGAPGSPGAFDTYVRVNRTVVLEKRTGEKEFVVVEIHE